MQYFSQSQNGKVFAIVNCEQRQHDDDAMVALELDAHERKVYDELKESGSSDSGVFRALFPPQPVKRPIESTIRLSVHDLTKKQLIQLVQKELLIELPTMQKMSIGDLQSMLLALKQKRRH